MKLCMEYCCQFWNGAPSCYLKMLDKLQKQIFRIAGPLLVSSFEHLAHCENIRAKLWNSLPMEYFPLAYDLNGFKARINIF